MKKKKKFIPNNKDIQGNIHPTENNGKNTSIEDTKMNLISKNILKKGDERDGDYKKEGVSINNIKDVWILTKSNIGLLLLISIFSFLVYWKVVKGEFLNIDDLAGIVQNPNIRSLKTAFQTGLFHEIYYAVIFKFFGLNSTAFHTASIVNHIFNAYLVFILTYILFGKKISLITTALFTVNPTGAEAINWISASGYLQQTNIAIINIIVFILYRRSKEPWYFVSSVLIYGINLIIQKTAWSLTIPFIIVTIDILLLTPIFNLKKILKYIPVYIPYILLSLIFVFTNVLQSYQQRAFTLETQHYLNLDTATPYLNRIPYSMFMISKQYLFPKLLTIYHEGRVIGNTEYTIMIIYSILLISFCVYMLKKNKIYPALICLTFLTTLPSFSPVAIAWLVAERYLYFGTAFFCMLVAHILIDTEEKMKLKKASIIFGLLIFLLYSGRTFLRAEEFSNSKNLWLATMKAAPLSYRVYNNLGDVYAGEGNYDLAIENFMKSLELKPDYADAVHNLGYTYMQMKDVNKARYYLQKSYEMNPRLYQSLFKLGYIELQLGNLEGAKYYLQRCLEVSPGNGEAIQLLDQIYGIEENLKRQGIIPVSPETLKPLGVNSNQ